MSETSTSILIKPLAIARKVTLYRYRQETGVTFTAIARKCKVSPTTMSNIARGASDPSYALAKRIEDATHGAVPASNWYTTGKDGAPVFMLSEQAAIERSEFRNKLERRRVERRKAEL